ncbi:hypothetical protein B0T17DRAFT_128541 [Bombardia bombarda]|uniref:Abc transporter protein n=1 Tax=Bombardia bombarda TaxID=252184 RepID=A0AA39U238_9PEZI|nr:hypothetical protein B0T17DRAFT_128541 [Bombardia bombarda]
MGRPSLSTRPSGDAVSLHSVPGDRFLDDDAPELEVDDLPPLYDEVADGGNGNSSSAAPLLPNISLNPSAAGPDPSRPSGAFVTNFKRDVDTGAEFYIDSRIDTDPEILESHVQYWAQKPPRPFVRIVGTHSQVADNNGKKEKKTVTDFDLQVELTPHLVSSWREVRTVDNSEKVRRGTALRKRAPGAKQSIELGMGERPSLAEWCHRYCASHAGLKCFALQRRVLGFDEEKVRQKLTSLVRATNYKGHLTITFPVKDALVEVYNDCRINRWRLTTWIIWMCMFTLMFLFTWPFLFFRTKRFEVVYADWPFSVAGESGARQYVSISEDQWYNMWGRAISRAVLEKRQTVLDQQDLLTSNGPDPVYGDGLVDGAMNFLRAGVNAMNEVNRQLGWGYDS